MRSSVRWTHGADHGLGAGAVLHHQGTGAGSGLGLSISHAIVKDHGGEIECESTVGEGTVFRVRLPISQALPL